jgi:hypothetical protein
VNGVLIELLLPLYDNDGVAFGRELYAQVRRELTDTFGGVTAHLQAPAEGLWEDGDGRIHRDRVVIVEVMAETLDRAWWTRYRDALLVRFRQDALVVRATGIETL